STINSTITRIGQNHHFFQMGFLLITVAICKADNLVVFFSFCCLTKNQKTNAIMNNIQIARDLQTIAIIKPQIATNQENSLFLFIFVFSSASFSVISCNLRTISPIFIASSFLMFEITVGNSLICVNNFEKLSKSIPANFSTSLFSSFI